MGYLLRLYIMSEKNKKQKTIYIHNIARAMIYIHVNGFTVFHQQFVTVTHQETPQSACKRQRCRRQQTGKMDINNVKMC